MSKQKCTAGLLPAAKDTVVLALEVGESSVLKSPDRIKKILQDKTVWSAVEKALKAEAERLAKKHHSGQRVTQADALAMGKKAVTAAQKPVLDAAKKQVTSSPEFGRLKHSLKDLGCEFKKSPIGVFVDENKGWLILVGVGLAVGGATAMYVLRDGDMIAGGATSLAGKSLRFTVLGNVTLGAKSLKFVPSKRQVGATTFAEIKWQKVETKFEAAVEFKDDRLAATSGRGEVVVKVAESLKLNSHASVGYRRPTETYQPSLMYDLGLGLSYVPGSGINITAKAFAKQDHEQRKLGGKGSVDLKLVGGGSPTSPVLKFNSGVSGNRTTTFGPTGPATQQEIVFDAGLKLNF